MQAIYNRQGQVVAWLNGKDLYDIKGNFIGFFIGHAVYNSNATYSGILNQSFFRDIDGRVVAFMNGAKNGPALPSLKSKPSRPIKKPRPSTKVAPPPPSPKPPKFGWSKLQWEDFMN
ncbi:4-fold beta flower protein [Lutimonas vermicola]|uniref:4-fold beta flower protein n=1 Tax=Lutimonas vermicola TaxID=414288 RepID=A0ABU9L6M0_9FLAO